MVFNPNTPAVAGLEWMTVRSGASQIASRMRGEGVWLPGAPAADLDEMLIHVADQTGAPLLAVDIYEADVATVEIPSELLVEHRFRPSVDAANLNAVNQAGSATSLFESVNETVENPGTFVRGDGPTGGFFAKFWYGARLAIGSELDDRRIISFAAGHRMRVQHERGGGTVAAWLIVDGEPKGPARSRAVGPPPSQEWVTSYDFAPIGGRHWNVGDVTDFAGGGGSYLVFASDTRFQLRLTQLWLQVVHAAENRVATGITRADTPGWLTFPLTNPPMTADGWSRDADQPYVAFVRPLSWARSAAWSWVDSDRPGPHGITGSDATLDGVSGRIVSLGEDASRSPTVLFVDDEENVDPAWTQPYLTVAVERVFSGRTVEQQFTAPATSDYQFCRLVCAAENPATVEPLEVRVRQTSDDSQVGGVLELSPDLLSPARTHLQVVDGLLATPAALTNTTSYYIELSSASLAGRGWLVAVARSDTTGEDHTFAGAATVGGVTEPAWDVPVTVATVPDTPDDFAAAASMVGGFSVAVLTWSATSLAAGFAGYEIERADTDSIWVRVADVVDEATTTWTDFEARPGTVSYRLRVRRADMAGSEWTSVEEVTITATGVELLTNTASGLSLRLDVVSPDRHPIEIRPLDSLVHHELHGLPGARAVRDVEDRLDEISLAVQALAPPPVGRHRWDPLVDLRDADVPHLCLRSSRGERWFVSLEVGAVREEVADRITLVRLTFRELTRRPPAVTVV